jgi:hypothetical protein
MGVVIHANADAFGLVVSVTKGCTTAIVSALLLLLNPERNATTACECSDNHSLVVEVPTSSSRARGREHGDRRPVYP